jgi:transglutaminase-like putative cysteine protease
VHRKITPVLPAATPHPEDTHPSFRQLLLGYILFFITMEAAVLSVETANWTASQPPLTLILLLATLPLFFAALYRLPGWIIHTAMPLFGLLVTLWQGLTLSPAGTGLFSTFSLWLNGGALTPVQSQTIFGTLLSFLVWFSGYLSAWSLLRKRNAWAAVITGVLIILVNLEYLPGRYFWFFPAFFIAAVFLIIQTRIVRRSLLAGKRSGLSWKGLFPLFASLVCVIILASGFSWVIPQARVTSLQNLISTKLTWQKSFRSSRLNILNAIPSKTSLNTSNNLKQADFSKGWNQGTGVVFTIKANTPDYWAVHAYDVYTAEGWRNSPDTDKKLKSKQPLIVTTGEAVVRYQVTSGINSDVLLVAGNFISSSSPVTVAQNAAGDVTGVTAPRILAPGESYTMETVISDPDSSKLSVAGANYSDAVKNLYLQLPATLPDTVRALADNVTVNASTPYDKAMAVVKYLSAFPYKALVAGPEPGEDGVAYFLFEEKSGFCLYFASAMAIMLRIEGVPARVVVGYLPGDPGSDPGTYVIKDSQYHAWTQVYFPGTGWVNFEATPGGQGGSQIPVSTAIVSTPAIRSLPQWDIWEISDVNPSPATPSFYPTGLIAVPGNPAKSNGPLFFARDLGIALLLILILAAAYLLLRLIISLARRSFSRGYWRVNRDSLANSTYAQLSRLAALAKIEVSPHQTPLELAAALKDAAPEQSAAVDEVITAYQESRFGGRQGKPGLYEEAELLKARRQIFEGLFKRAAKKGWGWNILTR